jgi:hypothetical protein
MSLLSTEVRKQVRDRAQNRCEYCGKPNRTSFQGYHVDHIRSLKQGGSSEVDNLAWACFECNIAKGTDIAAYDPVTDQITPLFNPRKQRWSDHFQLEGAVIVGKTPAGRTTVKLLQMNDPAQVEVRQELLDLNLW